ncbi:sensor histidine kinase [Ruania halotolerans]|uniref:sensor histidine kinase n=1 Tax=Ruania halotolerans TaxID=2897773 RepID=UPI001E2DF4E3|nr:sensor histidine kinase [Ruania halotolerans]UFU05705.1 sensor histidine kinase [Ruania halotolerans]
MSTEADLRARAETAERRDAALIRVLPFALLAVSTLITLGEPLPVNRPLVLALTVAAALWLGGFVALYPRRQASRLLMGGYYAGLMVLAGVLVVMAPWYGIFAIIGWAHAFECLGGAWRYVGATLTSMIMAVTYLGGMSRIDADEWWLWLSISALGAVLSSACLYGVQQWIDRSQLQQQALSALHQANLRLEEAADENAGLHAQLLVQAREAGVHDERQRMAREIHDTLAQSLAGILTQLQAAEQSGTDPAGRPHLAKAMKLAREGLTEARRTVHAVEPELLAEALLPEAINDVARKWSQAHRVEAVLTTTGDPRPMHTEVEVTLLRAAQESLANVAKHARAGRVGITLSYMADLVTLDVRDDGVGFVPQVRAGGQARADGQARDGGFGLIGMRRRAQRLAGRVEIESEPGGGTAISVSVPAIPVGGER